MRSQVAALLLLATACTPGRPGFPEPDWGTAPPPRVEEITEITFDHQHCDRSRCTNEVVTLNRAGGASQEFFTGNRHDSTRVSSIDSTSFVEAAQALLEAGFFGWNADESKVHEPLAVDSWILSGATLCRRRVAGYATSPETRRPVEGIVPKIETIAHSLRWKVPVFTR